MATILVATGAGCRVFADGGERAVELAGRQVNALASEPGGSCAAVVDGREIWRRAVTGSWTQLATSAANLQSIMSVNGVVFAGGSDQAILVRVLDGEVKQVTGFDRAPGRGAWFAGGPPLGVRSLAATAERAALLAAVHVGGIPRSADGGETWEATLPIAFDVHEVRAHPSIPSIVVAAAAAGLCVSEDGGRSWRVISEGLEGTSLLAVAVIEREALFSVQDGPFAKRSQVWRWRIGEKRVEQVRDGLPEWLEGKVDTGLIAAGGGGFALVDGGGNLRFSREGSRGWELLASGLPYSFAVAVQ